MLPKNLMQAVARAFQEGAVKVKYIFEIEL